MAPQTTDDPMTELVQAMALGQAGDRAGARAAFDTIWLRIGEGGPAVARMAAAHWAADVQDDPHVELTWDERALAAAGDVTEDDLRAAGMAASTEALYPSLHLNLGDVLHRLGRHDEAREQLRLGRAAAPALPDDGYGTMIRDGLEGLAARLDHG